MPRATRRQVVAPACPSAAACAVPRPLVACAVLALLGAGAAQAQISNALTLVPFASVTETVSDNHNASATGGADAVTQLTGGLSLRGRSARLEGSLDYALSQLLYARNSGDNRLQHDLSSRLRGSWWDNRLTLDASAAIGRRAASVFGVTSTNSDSANSNLVEQRSWRVAPGLRGVLGPDVAYESQVAYSESRVGGGGVGDNRLTQGTLHLGPNRNGVLNLAGDYQHITSAYRNGGRTTSTDRLYGTLSYALTAWDLRLSANAGQEYSNLLTTDRRRYDTWGVGAQWVPSPRTRLQGSYDSRPFGQAHQLLGEYRTAFTAWRLSSSRDVSYGSSQDIPAAQGSALTQLYSLLSSVQPDPLQRLLLAYSLLTNAGESISEPLNARYLTGAASLQTRQELNVTYSRQRDTLVFTLSRSSSRRIDPLSQLLDEVIANPNLRTLQASLSWSHPLTADSSLLAQLSASKADSDATSQHSRQWQALLGYDVQLGRHVRVSLALRHGQYDLSGGSSYGENALTATLGARY